MMRSIFRLPCLGSLLFCISFGPVGCTPSEMTDNAIEKSNVELSSHSENKIEQPSQINKLAPTRLTLVCLDSNNTVLDTVVVADDGRSGEIRFSVPDSIQEIRVFAVGDRIDEFFKTDHTFTQQFIVGKPSGQPDGFGFLEASIDEGLLNGISPNNAGMFPLELNDLLEKQIADDIAADRRSELTDVSLHE